MAVDVNLTNNIKIEGLDQLGTLANSLQSLDAKLSSLADAFTVKDNPVTSSTTSSSTTSQASGLNKIEIKSDTALLSKLDQVIGKLENLNKTTTSNSKVNYQDKLDFVKARNDVEKEHKENLNSVKLEHKQRMDEYRNSQANKNWAKALLTSSAIGGVSLAGQSGAVSGAKTGSINAGIMNYNDFMQGYYNRQQDLHQSMFNTGLMGVAAAGAMFGGPVGTLAGAGIAGVGSYLTNQSTSASKAQNEFIMNQERANWQLGIAGLGGGNTSNQALRKSTGEITRISNLQSMGMQDQYAGYLPTLSSTVLGGKRDVISRMSNLDKVEYNKKLTDIAQAMGVTDLGSLNKSATVLSSITGESPSKTLDKLLDTNVRYGGDTAANTAKLVQILETTPMGKAQASDLVNRYQYNDAMLNNKIIQSTANPNSLFQKYMYMKIGGATPQEMESGTLNKDHIAMIARVQERAKQGKIGGKDWFQANALLSAFGATGENPYATNVGEVKPGQGFMGPLQSNQSMNDMKQWVIDSLKDISIPVQNVTAGAVYLNGNMTMTADQLHKEMLQSQSAVPLKKSFSFVKGMPKTGVGANSLSSTESTTTEVPPIMPLRGSR